MSLNGATSQRTGLHSHSHCALAVALSTDSQRLSNVRYACTLHEHGARCVSVFAYILRAQRAASSMRVQHFVGTCNVCVRARISVYSLYCVLACATFYITIVYAVFERVHRNEDACVAHIHLSCIGVNSSCTLREALCAVQLYIVIIDTVLCVLLL